MSELAPWSPIRREELDGRRYLDSLLSLAFRRGLLGPGALEGLRAELLSLLAQKCGELTGGASSSVRVETAEELGRSIRFTLGVWLKTFEDPCEALDALVEVGVREGYRLGSRNLLILVRSTRQFYRQVLRRRLPTENEMYNATLDGGISGFFKLYRPDFAAHLIHITADYPTLRFPEGYEGLEFIRLYLDGFWAENLFCGCFEEGAVRRVLALHAIRYGSAVKDLVCNLCEPVLAAALACAAGGDPVAELALSPRGAARVLDQFGGGVVTPLLPFLETVLDCLPLAEKAGDYLRAVCEEDRTGLEQMILLLAKE